MNSNYLLALLCLISYPVSISATSSRGKAIYTHPRVPLSSLLYKGKHRYPSLYRQSEDSNQFSVTSYDNEQAVQNNTSASVQSTASVDNYEQVDLGNPQEVVYYPATPSNNYDSASSEDSTYYSATPSNTYGSVNHEDNVYYPAITSVGTNNNYEPVTSQEESIYYPVSSPTSLEHGQNEQQSTPNYLVSYESSNPSTTYDNVYTAVPYDSATAVLSNEGYSSQSNEILPPSPSNIYDTTPSTYYTSPMYYDSSNGDASLNQPIIDPYQELLYSSPQITEEELMEGASDPAPVIIYQPVQTGPGGGAGYQQNGGGYQQSGGGPQQNGGGSQQNGGGANPNGRPPSTAGGIFGVPVGIDMDDVISFGDDDGGTESSDSDDSDGSSDDSAGGDGPSDDDTMMDMMKPVDPTADDNNPLNFLNMVGTDFQPGRLVNIFFGLFIMLFMIIIHGYALWILGIAFLPGTRSLNQWEVNYDKVESACNLVLDAIEYWDKRAD